MVIDMFKSSFNIGTIICISLLSGILTGQVTAVKYFINHNDQTGLYDCHVIITEGNAKIISERTQFNAQYSIVVPTGSMVKIAHKYMPLQDHQNYTGKIPCEWRIASVIKSPEAMPEKDMYGIVPTLGPSAQYNDLKAGDTIKLFSIDVDPLPLKRNDVRLFENNSDPTSSALGMRGANFANGFTIGGVLQRYTGNFYPKSPLQQINVEKSKNKELKQKNKGS